MVYPGYTTYPILLALAISLTTFASVWTFFAYRRRGLAGAVRGLGLMLMPFGLLFTGVLLMALNIVNAIGLWAARLVFSPAVWLGFLLLLVSVALFYVGGRLGRFTAKLGSRAPAYPGESAPRSPARTDTEMDEIEDLLRKRGIT